jgi:ACT domain-containing protein
VKFTEEDLRRITLTAINELGEKASPELVKKVVAATVEGFGVDKEEFTKGNDKASGRVILTAFGLNKPGIIASLTKALGESNCDIQDLSQKLMSDFFTVIMVVDISGSNKELRDLQNSMNRVAEEMKIKVYMQHEDVFRLMHRI